MKRRNFTSKFKTKVVLASLKEDKTLAQLGQQYDLSPTQISKWKREFLAGAEQVFSSPNKQQKTQVETERDRLLKTIGELKVENDYLKKNLR
ncbi:MAG: transposase [Bacteroidota bacterium]